MDCSFWRWLRFWLCVPLYWMAKDGNYWQKAGPHGLGRYGYRYFRDFRKAMIGE